MKKAFQNVKGGMFLSGIACLALGLIMVIKPDVVNNVLRFILGGGLALFGVLEVVFVFVKPNGFLSVGRIIPGILSLAVGLVFLFRFDTFVSLLWILLGVSILIDGVYKLQYAFELKAAEVRSWWVNLLVSLAALVFATVLMIEPFAAQKAMTVLTGILLIVNAVFDFVSAGMMTAFSKQIRSVGTAYVTDADESEKDEDPALLENREQKRKRK